MLRACLPGEADREALKNEVRDSHWMMTCGDCSREVGYAARKIGVDWVTI